MKPILLIASVDGDLQQGCQRYFTAAGYTVESAAGGIDCLSRLEALGSAVLILDLEVPWGGGDGVLARLREDLATIPVPVVLLTSNPTSNLIPGLLVPPVFAYYRKPVSLDVLAVAVRSARIG
jgi:CheY-like chemotaxis protein